MADPYSAVIADLEQKRAEIDKLIESLKAFRKASELPRPIATATVVGEFTGLSMADAGRKVLMRANRPMPTADILEALEAGGLESSSENKLNTLGSILNRRANDVGDIVRIGRGTWATREWAQESRLREMQDDPGEQGPQN